jgi:hypothetical protein
MSPINDQGTSKPDFQENQALEVPSETSAPEETSISNLPENQVIEVSLTTSTPEVPSETSAAEETSISGLPENQAIEVSLKTSASDGRLNIPSPLEAPCSSWLWGLYKYRKALKLWVFDQISEYKYSLIFVKISECYSEKPSFSVTDSRQRAPKPRMRSRSSKKIIEEPKEDFKIFKTYSKHIVTVVVLQHKLKV